MEQFEVIGNEIRLQRNWEMVEDVTEWQRYSW